MASVYFNLPALGWDGDFAASLKPGHVPARVTRVDRGTCDVFTADGELRAAHSAALKRAAAADPVALPCVGDWVAIDGDNQIQEVLPRRSSIVRAGVTPGVAQGQVLAANVDVVYIAEPAVPRVDLGRIERFLALAWESGAQPVVLITKADLTSVDLAEVEAAAPGATVRAVSSLTGEGLEEVRIRPARTAVLLGKSGAGKSTLVNALAGADRMATQEIRAADGRGRHTTAHRELLLLPGGGMIIDTPGLRSIGLYDAEEGLSQAFSELEELAGQCRFHDCAHEAEPGCAVLAAAEEGELSERRLASWRKLQREALWMASRTDARLRAEKTREWKIIHKSMRGRNRP
ncbi:ribosome small subunit-dependent GTPase A [Streptosporangium nondiastaticum]|uniref:Small ribosomal subunit biogenesis GTPase RsgA n=1 Tax=Streptosporangium nondiastaticum TaxID=35764 RepID=A0A9X7JTU7_9ACTN|nr:ribosome small subunit-dependent GTPase A [Streptosporangium nondiastaticum]PSJ29757.1 ribosome small subunit-dependent GTPase A [Streptosporangium nondiastaticum]